MKKIYDSYVSYVFQDSENNGHIEKKHFQEKTRPIRVKSELNGILKSKITTIQ